MLKQLVALLHLSSLDLVTSGGFATVFLTAGSLPYSTFNGQEVLTTSTDKANLFARNVSCNSTLDDGSQQLPDFLSRTEQRLDSKNITAKMVPCAIYNLDASKAIGPDRIPAIAGIERSDRGKYHIIILLPIISKIFFSLLLMTV